jgi:hypothetical protein
LFNLKIKLNCCYKLSYLFKWLGDWRLLISILEVEGSYFCSSRSWKHFFFSWRLKVLVFTLREVEGFCFYYWRLKVLVLVLKEVKGFCFFSWRLKVFVLTIRKVESFYFYPWRLKVLVLVLRKFEGFCFYS